MRSGGSALLGTTTESYPMMLRGRYVAYPVAVGGSIVVKKLRLRLAADSNPEQAAAELVTLKSSAKNFSAGIPI